ncbi:MAG: excinuclease ABC subunit UvrB [Lentisphaerae bacterium]|nr:excinuclease ABC subunit UvrB [Lentisphaerota bacterium]
MAALFSLKAPYQPAGDQPPAIAELGRGLSAGQRFQTLEGVTGSGKTFTIANVIERWGKPTLIVSHNKTLAAQLYQELKTYFPGNAVEYFISYYDYYQPEAYIPQTDTYIEKDVAINEDIERLRLAATNALMNRADVIIVASVSCIYGLGSPEDYRAMAVTLQKGQRLERDDLLRRLVEIQYTRNDYEPQPGAFRVRGDTLDIFPSYSQGGVRVQFRGDELESLEQMDVLTGATQGELTTQTISPAKHFVMNADRIESALGRIQAELEERVAWFEAKEKLLEAQRLQQRTLYDLEMLREMGYCAGIENYSRHLSGRRAGEPPATLLDYFPGEFLTVLDESHVTLPQLRGMFNGDQARKNVLIEHGFRLPSARDNRPLNFQEFLDRAGPIICMSATPGPYEREVAPRTVPQIIRPTGLLDPEVAVRPLQGQVDNLIEEVRARAKRRERVLVTTLSKKTAEDLSAYLRETGLRVTYLHSDIDAIERVEVLRSLRKGEVDCLVGVNLLREGLDLPEVSLVAILDADKEGFLRSETALIQTAGRAARHKAGRVILYADQMTDSMRGALSIMKERRERQAAYNRQHGITPRGIQKSIQESLVQRQESKAMERRVLSAADEEFDLHEAIQEIEREMLEAADALEFERAADLRDQLFELSSQSGGASGGKRALFPASGRMPVKRTVRQARS